MLLLTTETHDILDSRAVVPTPVENDNFTRGGKVCHVTLHVHLALLAVGWGRKGHYAEHTGADTFRDRFDCAALSGSVAPFKHKDDALSCLLHPFLKLAKFDFD